MNLQHLESSISDEVIKKTSFYMFRNYIFFK